MYKGNVVFIVCHTFCGEGCISYTLDLILMDFSFFLNMNRRIVITVWTTALTADKFMLKYH